MTKNITILYAGRTGLGIDSSLKNIAEAITIVNKNENWNIKLILQTTERPTWIDPYECVDHRSFTEYSKLPELFSRADFLILPYDFNPTAVEYIKFSMPTKATEYMVSGTPIIIFAPEDTAIVKYAQEKKWAEVVTQNSPKILAERILFLIQSETARQKIAENAKQIAEREHDIELVRAQFKKTIVEARFNKFLIN